MGVRYLGTNSPDGSVLGLSTGEKVGFYGTTAPVARPAGTTQTAVRATALSTTASASQNTTNYKNVCKDVNATKALLNKVRKDLVSLNLIKGSS